MTVLGQKTGWLLLVLLLLVLPLGCRRGPARPDDLPALTACTLTITYKGTPLSEATVTLVPASGKWVGVGQTGTDGKAIVRTNGRYEGVPPGSYTVTVTKRAEAGKLPPDPTTPEEDMAYSKALKAAESASLLVPKKYTQPDTSGLTVKVTDRPVSETLELTD